jgi:hypothetical protein
LEAEREERKLIRQEQEERDRRNFEGMQEIRKEGWRKVRHPVRFLVEGQTALS